MATLDGNASEVAFCRIGGDIFSAHCPFAAVRILHPNGLAGAISERVGKHAKVVVCGVGNELRGDDAVGLRVAERLSKLVKKDVAVMICGEVPENYLSEVVRYSPSHLIIVDAAHMGLDAGTVVLVECEEIYAHSISTHRLPLSLFAKMVSSRTGKPVDTFVLGVQVQSCDFGAGLAGPVQDAAELLSQGLAQALTGRKGHSRPSVS